MPVTRSPGWAFFDGRKSCSIPQVELHRPGPEPAAASRLEGGRLGDLGHAEGVDVERAQPALGAGRRAELDVVDGSQHQAPLRATTNTRRNGNAVPWGVAG
ncbi:hypothetical protein RKD23_004451 [Streptomyces sp. SAI-170]